MDTFLVFVVVFCVFLCWGNRRLSRSSFVVVGLVGSSMVFPKGINININVKQVHYFINTNGGPNNFFCFKFDLMDTSQRPKCGMMQTGFRQTEMCPSCFNLNFSNFIILFGVMTLMTGYWGGGQLLEAVCLASLSSKLPIFLSKSRRWAILEYGRLLE